ncbi:molybdopterin-dependent oxidoreductase [uncultured Tateyamaria sp.]|uniref:molybdopterin-dependent oxidoreductase n=1 Tax=uncultured Tateyamaria sp. TaxID=455651 RepID=UPI002636633B|nr:molybdopterin-dependent oxidoreductase [uncultured Tateyamaria sp.]
MKYTAAHWGTYTFNPGDADLTPLADDPLPSRIGRGWVSASRNSDARILAPVARKGWLDGDRGANRCDDSFVEISWERALDLAAEEITRVSKAYGNQAIFGGSYGWSSAGRFHHAQSQMRRLLALAGGFTSSRETYSHAAAEVLFPHILGLSIRAFQDQMTTMPLVTEHCELMLAFGGISARTAQITSSGTSTHEVGPWLADLSAKGVRVVSIAPERGETGEWLSIRPGTDTALILALIHEIVAAGLEDEEFLQTCTSGWETLKSYVMGTSDGVTKSAEWAAPICDIQASVIRALADELPRKRVMISMAWGMQRSDHGEQPIWAGLALACVLGQIGQRGTGYSFGYGSTTPVGRAARLIPWPSLPKAPNPIADFIPVARIADALLYPNEAYSYNGQTRKYPDLKLIWWSGGNPFHHHQDLFRLERAWTRPETVIVSEHSWTATARRADLVLPSTTPLERDDLMMNRRDRALFYMSRFHEPLGQARDDYDICQGIATRLGIGDAFSEGRTSADWLRHMWERAQTIGTDAGFAMPSFDAFKVAGRFDVPAAGEVCVAFDQFVKDPDRNPLDTHSGRLTLTNANIATMGHSDCPSHPMWLPPAEGGPLTDGQFHLISGQPATRLHGQNDQGSEAATSKHRGREVCTLHPDAAARIGVDEGDILKLSNARGACLCAARIADHIRADCLSLPTGAWFNAQIINGERIEVHGNPNALTLDKGCSALSQGNIAHTCVVRAEKWRGDLPALTVTKPPRIDPA